MLASECGGCGNRTLSLTRTLWV